MWLWSSALAHGAACCGGSTTYMPVRVGADEQVLAGVAAGSEVVAARWTSEGAVTAPSPDERAVAATVAAGYRFTGWGQVGVSLPARFTWREAAALRDSGGGLGDVAASVILDPVTEEAGPVPVVQLGVRLPTGRTWEEADGALLADATGLPGTTASASAWLERTAGSWPWSIGGDVEVSTARLPARVGATVTAGRYLGTSWTALAMLRGMTGIGASSAARTTAAVRIVHGQPRQWRGWAELGSDVAIPGLGRSDNATLRAALGVAIVR